MTIKKEKVRQGRNWQGKRKKWRREAKTPKNNPADKQLFVFQVLFDSSLSSPLNKNYYT